MKKEWFRKKGREIAAVLVCMAVLALGVMQKEGYHMDELLSFELANAQFNPWIVPTQPQGRLAKFVENEIAGESFGETLKNLMATVKDVLVNRGNSTLLSYKADVYDEPVWITAEQFTDYVTVDEKDAFQYLSVYFNVKDDNHPPLYFMALHTVSSLFRGRLAPFMGCVINLAAIAGILLLLMQLGKMLAPSFGLEKSGRFTGIFAAVLYGLSTGALASVLLIRMYAMVTFFCVALFYLCIKKWRTNGFGQKNFPLIAVTVLGFWSQYFFLFYCITLVALLVLLLWKHKRRREAFCLIRSMTAAAAAGLLGFPFAIADVLSSGRGVEALENLSQGFAGYGGRLKAFFSILLDRTFGGFGLVLAGMALMCLVWMLGGRCFGGRGQAKNAPGELRGSTAAALLAVPPAGYFLLAARMSPYLVDRYIMPVFPFAVLAGALTGIVWLGYVREILARSGKKIPGGIFWGILLLVQVYGLFHYDGSYLYRGYAAQEQFAEAHADIPCICVYEGVGYYENLPEFMHYEKTLLVKPRELAERKDTASVAELEEVAVLIKPGVDREQVQEILERQYGLVLKETFLGTADTQSPAHGDILSLFERTEE